MDDFKKLTEQLFKVYINAESVDNFGIENYFDENISLIGTGKHELFTNLHEFLESFKFDVEAVKVCLKNIDKTIYIPKQMSQIGIETAIFHLEGCSLTEADTYLFWKSKYFKAVT